MEKKIKLNDLAIIAKELINKAKSQNSNTATLITLSGDLGSGKTTLTKEIAKELDVKENVISPTFVIMKSYHTNDKIFKNMIHIDAYRLNNSQELVRLGWEELLGNRENLIILEWPEMVPECIDGACKVTLAHVDENTRSIVFH